ncbi:hypothetical protein SO694_00028053 [Aureococcus anophagefferens]|uniref:Uncharacterized protein n=1 Tax=Aureococcus anophagefferens TaxID=44056 RepID=A0ABR1FVH5_AURAN
MVVLATRLGVPLGDVLSIATSGVREWAEKTGFEARVAADYALWRNASARVRRDVRPLERELAEYRRLVARRRPIPALGGPANFEEDRASGGTTLRPAVHRRRTRARRRIKSDCRLRPGIRFGRRAERLAAFKDSFN